MRWPCVPFVCCSLAYPNPPRSIAHWRLHGYLVFGVCIVHLRLSMSMCVVLFRVFKLGIMPSSLSSALHGVLAGVHVQVLFSPNCLHVLKVFMSYGFVWLYVSMYGAYGGPIESLWGPIDCRP